jgi:hypothetical protein
MDQVYPAHSNMAEEVFGRPLREPWDAFPNGLLSLHRCFLE